MSKKLAIAVIHGMGSHSNEKDNKILLEKEGEHLLPLDNLR